MKNFYRGIPYEISLGESLPVPNRVQILRVGSFYDVRYGKFNITSDMLKKMKENYDNNVRRVQLAFDYNHESDKEASGWFTGLELAGHDTELWAQVEWTETGAKKLGFKEYRYASADFHPDYQDNETLEKFGPCLLGAGLTNRPVIKDLNPVILTEDYRKEDVMDPKDQKIKDLEAMVAELKSKLDGSDVEMGAMKKKLGEFEEDAKKSKEAAQLAEKESKFTKLLSEKKAVPAQKEAFMSGDMEKFISLSEALNTTASGNAGTGNELAEKEKKELAEKEAKTKDEAIDQVIKLAEGKRKENKEMELGDAISLVLSENPKLRELYEKAN